MVRVLFVNTRSAIGADVAVHLSLIRHLDPARCEVHVATNSRAVDHARMREILGAQPHVHASSLDLGREIAGRGKLHRIAGAAANLATLGIALARLAWLVRRRRIDVIHSTDRPRDVLVATLLAKLTGRRNLIHVHIKWHPEIGRITRWGLEQAGGVLAISRFVRQSLIDGGVPPEKIHTAHNATDPDEFAPARVARGSFRRHLGISDEIPLVGIVARIMVWKGHLELVEAMARVRATVPDARLVIVGEEDRLASPDAYASRLRQRIEELGLSESVIWAGWHDDMPAVFADLDVVCVPSHEEPFGLVVTEAMAMERAVVGFESGALPEIIESGVDGLLTPRGDSVELAAAITRLLHDSALRAELGRNGRQRVLASFTPARQAAEVATIYEKVASGQSNVHSVTSVSSVVNSGS